MFGEAGQTGQTDRQTEVLLQDRCCRFPITFVDHSKAEQWRENSHGVEDSGIIGWTWSPLPKQIGRMPQKESNRRKKQLPQRWICRLQVPEGQLETHREVLLRILAQVRSAGGEPVTPPTPTDHQACVSSLGLRRAWSKRGKTWIVRGPRPQGFKGRGGARARDQSATIARRREDATLDNRPGQTALSPRSEDAQLHRLLDKQAHKGATSRHPHPPTCNHFESTSGCGCYTTMTPRARTSS